MHQVNLPIYDKEKCVLFALGRNAMYAGCLISGLKAGDEVLTPAFDCDGSLQPFRVLGAQLKFFRSDPYTFSADIADLRKKISPKTKLLHIINHFGISQPWDDLLSLREETGIAILEDNAYSLFSRFRDKPLGTFGDVSVFSLRKNLPLLDGGLLRINNPRYELKMFFKKYRLFYPIEFSNFFKHKLSGNVPPPLYSEEDKGYPHWPLRDIIGREFSCDYLRPMSGIARFQLSRFSRQDYLDICNRKRQLYFWLVHEIGRVKGIRILWPDLPQEFVPFSLTLLIEKNRDVFLGMLRKKYEVMAWPTLPGEVLTQLAYFSDVQLLGRKLLQINLPADKVRLPHFPRVLKNLVRQIFNLSREYL